MDMAMELAIREAMFEELDRRIALQEMATFPGS